MSEKHPPAPTLYPVVVDADVITRINKALSNKGMNQSKLADRIGWHRSNVSKLLNGKIETIAAETADLINDTLGIVLNPMVFKEGNFSPTIMALSEIAKRDPEVAVMLESILHLASPRISPFIPHIETKRLPKIGAEITRIVHLWEEGVDPHYSKIAVEVLEFLRDFLTKEAKRK